MIPDSSFRMRFFAYSWKLPAYSGAFLVTIDNVSFLAYSWSFFACSFSFLTYSWSFFACSGKVRLIRALRNCKQRSLMVSRKTATVSTKTSPQVFRARFWSVRFGSECTKPSHSQSLANFVANCHSQGISAARTKLSQYDSQSRSQLLSELIRSV